MLDVYIRRRQNFLSHAIIKGLDYVLLTNPTNIYYFSGTKYTTYERFCGLLLNVETSETYLYVPALDAGRLKDTNISEITYQDGENALALIAEKFSIGVKIGVEKADLRLNIAEEFMQYAKIKYDNMFDISSLIVNERLIKDSMEIDIFREACRISDQMLADWRQHVQIGAMESDLKLELVKMMILADDVEVDLDFLLCSGPNTSIAHGYNNERGIKTGDPIMVDFGAIYRHYYSDITRTFFLGKPEEKMREIYEIVLEANLAGIAKVEPGRPLKEVDLAARNVIEKAGYGEFFTHRTGHGIGLDIHENPRVSKDNEQLMKPGMVFTVEPGIYLPNYGGVRIEDDVVVTENGCLILTHYPKELSQIIL